MKNLYQIQKEYLALAETIIDNDGELTTELSEQLAINEAELQGKGIAYGSVIKTLESDIDIIDAEIKRLQALKKSRNNTIDKLKETLTNAMNLYGITEIKTALMKINFRKSEAVECDEAVPLEYCRVIPESLQPDKAKIKEAIKSGVTIVGARIVEHQNIQLK